jgi:hypothetical protein
VEEKLERKPVVDREEWETAWPELLLDGRCGRGRARVRSGRSKAMQEEEPRS